MKRREIILGELRLALCFGGVGLVGLCIDAGLLRLGLGLGLAAWVARIISLSVAMQATFAINGLGVFRSLERARLLRQWSGYMMTNGFGNFCNYWIFLTLVSTHWPVMSNHYVALTFGSACAWLINFTGTRLMVFRRVAEASVPDLKFAGALEGPESELQIRKSTLET
jgi:putative flippase GtrA